MCVAIVALTAGSALAEMTRWHPYFVANNFNIPGISSPWESDWLTKIDSGVDNVVWNDTTVHNTGNAGESWYDVRSPEVAHAQEGLRLVIHNPTADDYTGGDKIQITLYDRDTGVQMTDADSEINNSPGTPGVSFNTSTDVWEVELDSQETIVLVDSDFVDYGESGIYVMKIYSPESGNGAFTAHSNRFNMTRWRLNKGSDQSDFHASYLPKRAFRSYPLQAAEDIDGLTSMMLILPYWLDSDDHDEKYTSYVHIANVDTVDLDITVEVFSLSGTSHKSYTFQDVPAQSQVSMIPSQFLDSGDPEEGYLQASAVQSGDTDEVGDILGVNHELQLSKVHQGRGGRKGWARELRGEALRIIDDN
jgi:hypothetical protein